MPEGRSKVICYSDVVPRYILMALSPALLLFALSTKVFAADQNVISNSAHFKSLNIAPMMNDPVHELIERHVRAIRTRDADRAYHLISVNQQESYGTSKKYWREVRDNMRLLFNHTSYKFLGQNHINGMVIQKVSMIDHDGKENLVIFRVKKDSADLWRIENIIVTSASDDRA
ncbi:MAG: DUF4864 domain-containing protein [Alphaproteobacteria bacterium]